MSICDKVAKVIIKKTATKTKNIAGVFPIPNINTATGIQATGEIGANIVTSGNTNLPKIWKYRIPKPINNDRTKPRANPAPTRIDDHAITPSTDKKEPPVDNAPALVPPGSKNLN